MSRISSATIEAMKMAIQLEKDGRVFYEEAARKTENKLGKRMFEALTKDEITHLQTFQKMFDAITSTGDWQELAQETPKVGKALVFEEGIKKKANANPGELDVLRTAMNIERKAIDFFNKVAKETQDPLAKKIFTRIRKEEEHHRDLLQAQIDEWILL